MFSSLFNFSKEPKEEIKEVKKGIQAESLLETVNVKNKKGRTVLHKTITNDNYDLFTDLLSKSNSIVSPYVVDKNGDTAIHLASKRTDDKAINYIKDLVNYSVNPQYVNVQNINGETSLHCAVEVGNFDSVEFILKYADTKIATHAMKTTSGSFKGSNGGHPGLSTALHYAFYSKKFSPKIINLLIENMKHLNVENENGYTPLLLAASSNNIDLLSLEILNNLIVKSNFNIVNKQDKNYLHLMVGNSALTAEKFNDILTSDPFKKNIPDILNNQDRYNQTPFLSALQGKNNNKALILLGYGADTDIGDGVTFPLHIALKNKMPIAINIIRYSQLINEKDYYNNTPLVYAAETGNMDAIEELKKHGANFKGPMGEKAIIKALANNHIDVVTKLIQYGANPNVHIDLDRSISFSSVSVKSGSFSSCSSYPVEDKTGILEDGDTPLHFSVKTQNYELAEACLKGNPNVVNSQNANGKTPVNLVIKSLDNKMATLFTEKQEETFDYSNKKSVYFNTLFMSSPKSQFKSAEDVVDFFKNKEYQLSEKQIARRDVVLEKFKPKQQPTLFAMNQVKIQNENNAEIVSDSQVKIIMK